MCGCLLLLGAAEVSCLRGFKSRSVSERDFFYGIEIVLRRALIMLGFSRGSPVGRMECGHLWVRGIRQRSCDFLLICNGDARSGLNKNYEAILLSMGEIEMDY